MFLQGFPVTMRQTNIHGDYFHHVLPRRRRLDLNLAQQEVAERAHLPATQRERIAAAFRDFRNPDQGTAP